MKYSMMLGPLTFVIRFVIGLRQNFTLCLND